MLRELAVSNFAIIGRLELGFGQGLSALTGETGAGKSVLVDAVSFLLGGRAGQEFLRDGAEASVEGLFDVSALPELSARMVEMGIPSQGGELVIRRAFSPGRGKVYINGSLATLSALQEIGDHLVDLHGQHEHQSLLKVETHMDLLDAYCGLADKAKGFTALYRELADGRRRLDEIRSKERERARRQDLLLFQRREIDEAGITPGEDEALLSERAFLVHADRLRSLSESAREALEGREPSALALLGEASRAVREMASLVPAQAEGAKLIEDAIVLANEAALGLRDFGRTIEADPARLSEVEARLDLLARLRKKYGESLGDVLAYRARVEEELAAVEGADLEEARLEAGITEAEAALREAGKALSGARRTGGLGFAGKVETELSGLGMEKARFEVRFTGLPAAGPKGYEKAEFMFSANPGEEPRPLVKVASGGELSRVMLALKVVLAGRDRVPTLVFDEVDTGVGGDTASALGRKLREAASGRQVLCITHLPQVASMAERHYVVEKDFKGGRTEVAVRMLDKEGRVREVARMLGGDGIGTASAHAAELVRQGELYG